jgi:hypothetical protein
MPPPRREVVDISSESAEALLKRGVLELTADGEYRTTTFGRYALSAVLAERSRTAAS